MLYLVRLFVSTLAVLVTYSAGIAVPPASAERFYGYDKAVQSAGGNERPGVVDSVDLTDESTNGELGAAVVGGARVQLRFPTELVAPRPGVLVEGAGSGTRTINLNAADPNWGLTQAHLDKHLFGSGPHSLSTIDSAGNPALWTDQIQDLAGRRVTSTTSNGMQDIIGTFPLADGSGTFQFGIRLSPNADGTFDLITLLTRQ